VSANKKEKCARQRAICKFRQYPRRAQADAPTRFGSDLTPSDYWALETRWIDRALAGYAGLRRVDSLRFRSISLTGTGEYAAHDAAGANTAGTHPVALQNGAVILSRHGMSFKHTGCALSLMSTQAQPLAQRTQGPSDGMWGSASYPVGWTKRPSREGPSVSRIAISLSGGEERRER